MPHNGKPTWVDFIQKRFVTIALVSDVNDGEAEVLFSGGPMTITSKFQLSVGLNHHRHVLCCWPLCYHDRRSTATSGSGTVGLLPP